MFTYLQPPSGLIVELVDRAVLPHFETVVGRRAHLSRAT